MSIEAMVWALEQQNLDPVDKLTLLGIANHADRFGANAWPSVGTLALYVGRSEMTVRRSLKRLVVLGLVGIEIQGGGSGRHGGYRPNRYTLSMRPNTGDSPTDERPLTDDGSGVTRVIGEVSHSRVRRTVLEPSSNRPLGFEEWWEAYPKRVGKKAALTAFKKALEGDDAPTVERLLEGAKRLADEGREYRFIPNPATWLNQGRWDDERGPAVEPPKPIVEASYCGSCHSGWVLRTDSEGVDRAFRCPCVKA